MRGKGSSENDAEKSQDDSCSQAETVSSADQSNGMEAPRKENGLSNTLGWMNKIWIENLLEYVERFNDRYTIEKKMKKQGND